MIIFSGQPSDKTTLFKSHVMHLHPIHAMSPCTCNANATSWYLHIYYMHIKELRAVFQNHASYQASWVSTSIACNSYPHVIHVNIFSMHIPTSFSQKNLHVIQTKKSTCKLDFFFPIFQLREKTTCIYQHHSNKKNCILFKPRNQHANWIFFPVFQLRKTTCMY